MEQTARTVRPPVGKVSGIMAKTPERNDIEFLAAVRGRRAQRMMTACVVALALCNLIGWQIPAAWIVAYSLVQLAEIAAFSPILKGKDDHFPLWRNILGHVAVVVSGAVYGSLAIALWTFAGAFGGVLAVLLLALGVLSVTVSSGAAAAFSTARWAFSSPTSG